MATVRIATRGSQLALWQAHHVRDRLRANEPGLEVELLVLKTRGELVPVGMCDPPVATNLIA